MCRKQEVVIEIHENEHVRSTGQGEARRRKYKRLKFGGGQGGQIQKEEFSITCFMCDTYT
jgi:hypothetical protein